MPATVTCPAPQLLRQPPATSTPRQGDLLDILNNPARVSAADIRKAKQLLKLWYPMSYNLWLEHNG